MTEPPRLPPCGVQKDDDGRTIPPGRWTCMRMTAAGLCDWCAGRAGGWLADLGSLLPRLPDALVPGRSGEQDRVSGGSREAPLPLRLDALSLVGPAAGRDRRWDVTDGLDPGDDRTGALQVGAEPVMSVLQGHCRVVAEERHLTVPTPEPVDRLDGEGLVEYVARWQAAYEQRWTRQVMSLRSFLATHHDWSRQQPWADEYAADVHDLWRTLRTVLNDWPARPDHLAGVPCKRCDAMAVHRYPGKDGRFCDPDAGGCSYQYTDEDWERWTKLTAHWAVKVLKLRPRPYERVRTMDALWYVVKAAEDATGHEYGCGCDRCSETIYGRLSIEGEAA